MSKPEIKRTEQRDEEFRRIFEENRARMGLNHKDAAELLKTTQDVTRRWRNIPASVKIDRLRDMADVGFITEADIIAMVFRKKEGAENAKNEIAENGRTQ